jgi:O-antigen/teichoic acid export membrane protein
LTPDEYGTISLILTVVSIFAVFGDLGLGSALGVYYFDYYTDTEKLKTYLSTILFFLLPYGLSLVLVAGLFGRSLFQPLLQNVPFSPYLLMAFAVGFFQVLFRYLQTFLQVEGKAGQYAIISSLSFLINVTLIIFFVVYKKEGVFGNSKADLITAAGFFLFSVIVFRQYMVLKFNWQNLKESLMFGLPLVPHLLSGWIMKAVDRFFINHYGGLVELGIYALGFQVGSILSVFTNSFNAAWVPFFMATAKEQGEGAKPIIARLTTYYLSVIFFLGILISLFAREAIAVVASAEYKNSFQVVPIIVSGYLLAGMYYMVASHLLFTKETRYLPFITFGGGGVQILLNLVLVPRYSIVGAAWAMFITNLWTFILTWFISSKVYPMRFETTRIAKIFLASFLIVVTGLSLNFSYVWYGLLTKMLLFLTYPFLLFFFGFFRSEELDKVKTVLRGILRTSIPGRVK